MVIQNIIHYIFDNITVQRNRNKICEIIIDYRNYNIILSQNKNSQPNSQSSQ